MNNRTHAYRASRASSFAEAWHAVPVIGRNRHLAHQESFIEPLLMPHPEQEPCTG